MPEEMTIEQKGAHLDDLLQEAFQFLRTAGERELAVRLLAIVPEFERLQVMKTSAR